MALTVEDGSGVPGADSYISVADATTYFTNYGGSDAWAALDNQEVSLRKASRDLDVLYGSSYGGDLASYTQSLGWPRTSFTDAFGRTVTGLPVAVAQATAELALLNATSDSTGVESLSGNIKLTRTQAGELRQDIEYFAPSSTGSAALRKVALLLGPFMGVGASGGLYATIVRG